MSTKNEPTQEQIEKLRKMLDEGLAMMQAAAQFAGENNIPLKFIDPYYEEPEDGEEDYDYSDDGRPQMQFGGQGFDLRKDWRDPSKFRWYNSKCY